MRIKKSDYISLIFAFILVLILFATLLYSFFAPRTIPSQNVPDPTPTQTEQIKRLTPTPTQKPLYQKQAQEILINRLENRAQLSTEDAAAKQKIIGLLAPGSNTLYQSPTIIIEYLPSADVFMVEILTIDIQKAKEEATNWFETQGVSQQGICNYPVQFYLNYDVAQSVKELKGTFSPLGIGCN
jgi:hypothetical protein